MGPGKVHPGLKGPDLASPSGAVIDNLTVCWIAGKWVAQAPGGCVCMDQV